MKNQETLVIRSGEENSLGKVGGELFLLPGRAVSIFDFRLDFGTKRLKFNGMCSSRKDPRGRSLNIVLNFENIRKMLMGVLTRTLDRPGTISKFRLQKFLRDTLDRDPDEEISGEDISDSDSDSDSSIDIALTDFDSDSESSADIDITDFDSESSADIDITDSDSELSADIDISDFDSE